MSHPAELEIARLAFVARELREVFEERGHHIQEAIEVDGAFGGGMTRSSLSRDLAIDAVSEAASKIGIDFRSVNGSGRELRWLADGVDRRYRLRRAHVAADGHYVVRASSDSALAIDGDSLLQEEAWVFAYVLAQHGEVEAAFVARILSYEEGFPGQLILGGVHELLTSQAPAGGFIPTDDYLPGFEDDASVDAAAGDE